MNARLAIAATAASLAACATSTPKAAWPVASSEPQTQPPAVSIAQGGPLESLPGPGGPPVEIRYEPFASPGHPPRTEQPLTLHWPLPATGVTSLFGRRVDPMDGEVRFHRGLDLEAEYGSVVKAAARGQVVAAGWNGGYGRQVVIEHPGGFQTLYAHLAQILVPLGSYVRAQQPIGLVGTSGRATGAHLHFEVTQWNRHLDPLQILGIEMNVR